MGHEMYHFGRPAIGHYYYWPTLNLLDFYSGVELKKI